MAVTDDDIFKRRQQPYSLKFDPLQQTTLSAQRHLNQAGFQSGPDDGILGPITEAAIRRFQQFCDDNGDKDDPSIINSGPIDGIYGPITFKALDHFYYSLYRDANIDVGLDPEDDPTI